jgi:hypothetical protein
LANTYIGVKVKNNHIDEISKIISEDPDDSVDPLTEAGMWNKLKGLGSKVMGRGEQTTAAAISNGGQEDRTAKSKGPDDIRNLSPARRQ